MDGGQSIFKIILILTLVRMFYLSHKPVDEATDFSPIQLACMATLARLGTRPFFVCGDFNQRITSWGTRSVKEMKWEYKGVGPI